MSGSLISDIMQPGGGIMLLPFVRVIISLLLVLTLAGFCAGVARIHMLVLSFLSAGLLFSLSFFEREFNKARGGSSGPTTTATQATSKSNKTD